MTVIFYDPHLGVLGCPVPFPEHLRMTAEWLDGKEMTTDEAVQCFKDAVPEHILPISVEIVNDCIMVTMGSFKTKNRPVHTWRAIRFRSS